MVKLRKIWPVLSCVLAILILIPLSAPAIITASSTEIVEARDRSSKTYDLGNNKFAIDVALGAVHYQDETGSWQEIDNQWAAAPSVWDWQMIEDGYHTSVLENFTAGQILLFESQGEYIAFQPMALEWTNVIDQIGQLSMPQNVGASIINTPIELLPNMSGSIGKIRWTGGYGSGRHFEWINTPARLSKLLTLDSKPPDPPQYIIDGGNPVLRLNFIFDPSPDLNIYVDNALWNKSARIQSFDTIEFRKDNEVLWGFMPAAYWDSGENVGVGVTELRKVGNSLYVSVRVPYGWLQTATYPVYIDPDIDLQVGASLDDVHEQGLVGTVSNISYIAHVASTFEVQRFWGGHRWVSGSLPSQGDTIDVAYAEVYLYDISYDDVDGFWHFEKAASPAQFTTSSNDVTDRTRTTASSAWDVDSLTTGWKQTPSLVTPLQEVIDSYSPTALVLIFRPNTVAAKAMRTKSEDGNPTYAAKIHVEWTSGAAAAGHSFGVVIG